MSEKKMLKSGVLRDILEIVIKKRKRTTMTFLSRGKWHTMKAVITSLEPNAVHTKIVSQEKPHSASIRIDQPVGVSFKHGYNKFLFETVVVGFEPSVNKEVGGKVVLRLPEHIESVQRRNYFRVDVPKHLKIKALFWHRGYNDDTKEVPLENYWQGRLIDISAGGAQIVVDKEQRPNFKKGQLVGLQFTPMPYERPLLIEGQIRHIAETADGQNICLGVQIIGLEATTEGREVLHQLCNIVEKYQQISQERACRGKVRSLQTS